MSNFKVVKVTYSDPPDTASISAAYEILVKAAIRILNEKKKVKAG
ncbi:MAG: hypothetical protein ABFC84_07105 [Veillonellales bacterium]